MGDTAASSSSSMDRLPGLPSVGSKHAFLQHSTSIKAAASSSSDVTDGDNDAALFDTPPDLLCPITLSLFKEPVVTSHGQVYERNAIEQHLRRRGQDPLTNLALASLTLTPVFLVRSRANEYREATAKTCVARACSLGCRSPLRYLRRAAELVEGCTHLRVPGMLPEVVTYLLTHASNAYDGLCLQQFAEGLRRSGYIEEAANVFYKLLEIGDDRAQQALALKQLLACWATAGDGDCSETGLAGSGSGGSVTANSDVVRRLAQFIDSQKAFTAGQILDLMQEAELPELLVLQLCAHLLAHQVQQQQQQQSGGGGGGGQQSGKYGDVLLRYTQLKTSRLDSEVRQLRAEVETLQAMLEAEREAAAEHAAQQAQHTPQHLSRAYEPLGCALAPGRHTPASRGGCRGSGDGPLQRLRRQLAKHERAITCGTLAVTTLWEPHRLLLLARAARVGSLLWLLHRRPTQQQQQRK